MSNAWENGTGFLVLVLAPISGKCVIGIIFERTYIMFGILCVARTTTMAVESSADEEASSDAPNHCIVLFSTWTISIPFHSRLLPSEIHTYVRVQRAYSTDYKVHITRRCKGTFHYCLSYKKLSYRKQIARQEVDIILYPAKCRCTEYAAEITSHFISMLTSRDTTGRSALEVKQSNVNVTRCQRLDAVLILQRRGHRIVSAIGAAHLPVCTPEMKE